jgi:hypothetical protein
MELDDIISYHALVTEENWGAYACRVWRPRQTLLFASEWNELQHRPTGLSSVVNLRR